MWSVLKRRRTSSASRMEVEPIVLTTLQREAEERPKKSRREVGSNRNFEIAKSKEKKLIRYCTQRTPRQSPLLRCHHCPRQRQHPRRMNSISTPTSENMEKSLMTGQLPGGFKWVDGTHSALMKYHGSAVPHYVGVGVVFLASGHRRPNYRRSDTRVQAFELMSQ